LTKVIKNCGCAVEQGATIGGRLDPLVAAIEETHAECIF
jgi:hypothetical protein